MSEQSFRIIVCGGRDYNDAVEMKRVLSEYAQHDPIIVHGDCKGADKLACRTAKQMGLKTLRHPARWDRYGKRAGPIRNEEMAVFGAELCIAFPGGIGTRDMRRCAAAHGIPIREVFGR